jgi:type II secretion system protein D
VLDVISFYETLTGKRIIRDSNLAGQELSIMVAKPVSREDAIGIIESSLLMNNYSIVPVDDQTIKILGPSRAPRTEGLPLLSEVQSLPADGDKVLSFYKPLSFISPEEAIAVVQGVVQINAYGSVVPVPNTNAIILTDKTPVIRKALGILDLIDVEPARVVTEFVQLQRANAERVVEMLDEMFGKEDPAKAKGPSTQQTPATPQNPEAPQAAGTASGARYENRLISGKAKFLADKRTNRILVVTRVENYRYVRDVISQLDSAGNFEQPLTRVLNFVPVNDVFPVLTDMLSDKDSETQNGSNQGSQNSSNNNSLNQNSNNNSSGGLGGIGGDGINKPDRLSNETQQGAPQSATIGEIRLIADNNSNSIIIFGPPESKARAKQILDILDQRPKQVYLAVVIGQLRLSKGVDYGVSYLIRNKGFQPLNNLLGNSDASGAAATSLSPSILPGGTFPNAASIVNPSSLTPALSSLAGLTIYGSIADSVDVFARFLESTERFRTLSRPVIYTTNNRKATILSGQKVPVPTQSLTSATGGGISGNGSAITSNIQYQDVVLKLEVIPLINSDDEVTLKIAQINDNIVGTQNISGNTVPTIGTQELVTEVSVKNGAAVVLGGLITERVNDSARGGIFLRRIPVIKHLFGTTQKESTREELLIFIQPHIIKDTDGPEGPNRIEQGRSNLYEEALEFSSPRLNQIPRAVPYDEMK